MLRLDKEVERSAVPPRLPFLSFLLRCKSAARGASNAIQLRPNSQSRALFNLLRIAFQWEKESQIKMSHPSRIWTLGLI
jgi:hypothetical protein